MKTIVRYLPIIVGLGLGYVLWNGPGALFPSLGSYGYLVVAAGVFVLLVAFVMYLILRSLPAKVELTPLPGPPPQALVEIGHRYLALGFQPAGPAYEVGISPPAKLIAVVHPTEPIYGTIFQTGTVPAVIGFDFVSILASGSGGLTTSADKRAGNTLARPGVFRQCFPGWPPEELLQRHREALAYLAQQGVICRMVTAQGFPNDFARAFSEQRRYFLSNPLKHALTALFRTGTRSNPSVGPIWLQPAVAGEIQRVRSGTR